MLEKKEKEKIILNDEPYFEDEDGEIWYSLGKTRDEGAKICRKILEAVLPKKENS